MILDIIGGVLNLLWSLAYFLSAGLVGSENWLAVKGFFIGIAEAVANPGAVWDAYWENLKREFVTIEGPLSDCRRAEFIVRKFVNGLVNIALIFVAGVGLAKGGIKLVRRAAQRIRTGRVRRRVEGLEPRARTDAPEAEGRRQRAITKTGDVDPGADALADRIGGQSSVRIEGFGNREFDAVSNDFVGQVFGPKAVGEVPAFVMKPKNFLSKSRRDQIRETLRAAKETGRSALFEFTGGKPHADVLDFIKRNAERQGVTPVFQFE